MTEGLRDTDYKDTIFASTDIRENIERPSLYVNFTENKTGLINKSCKQRTFSLQLFYFAKNREDSKIELLEVQDLLSDIFLKGIKITDDYYIHMFECDYDLRKDEGLLILNLNDLIDIAEIEECGEVIEDISINNTIEGK
ncbi:hypothetical protein OW729_04985 [Clostridium sp. ZC22-4]|uniref:Uncharacterized protein n=1 Tax=Clostridium brassicae TaxID=2999072 RepID=A0ABT4D6P8_9CLOT|nr:hypothetical protein [Clostridium brassicae]